MMEERNGWQAGKQGFLFYGDFNDDVIHVNIYVNIFFQDPI